MFTGSTEKKWLLQIQKNLWASCKQFCCFILAVNFFIMSKDFLYYCRISIKQGLDIETEKPHLERFIDQTFSRKCRLCCQFFIIAKNFKEDENASNSCFKITSDINEFGRMHIIWKDNSQYGVFTNLWRSFAQELMNKEDLIDKYRYIDVNKYNCKTI